MLEIKSKMMEREEPAVSCLSSVHIKRSNYAVFSSRHHRFIPCSGEGNRLEIKHRYDGTHSNQSGGIY